MNPFELIQAVAMCAVVGVAAYHIGFYMGKRSKK